MSDTGSPGERRNMKSCQFIMIPLESFALMCAFVVNRDAEEEEEDP